MSVHSGNYYLAFSFRYGFVTYENEGDAQKVIKEAENLIIKNRKLNVSTAVMKHQQNSFGKAHNPRRGVNEF